MEGMSAPVLRALQVVVFGLGGGQVTQELLSRRVDQDLLGSLGLGLVAGSFDELAIDEARRRSSRNFHREIPVWGVPSSRIGRLRAQAALGWMGLDAVVDDDRLPAAGRSALRPCLRETVRYDRASARSSPVPRRRICRRLRHCQFGAARPRRSVRRDGDHRCGRGATLAAHMKIR